jgi:Zn-dependent protease
MIYVLQSNPVLAIALFLGFIIGVAFHEAAHAFSAYYLGDETPYRAGRITLNPLVHLDLLGTIMFLAAGFGWGSTPVTPSNLRGGVWGPVAVAAAGPATNFAILLVCAGLAMVPSLDITVSNSLGAIVVFGVALVNALLFVLNLIPIPPLDGAKMLYPFLPRSLDGFVDFMNEYGPYIFLGLVVITFLPGLPSPFSVLQILITPLLYLLGITS